MDRGQVEVAIRMAFAGVRLGSGVSLRQAQVIDNYGQGVSDAEFEALPASEVTDDWTQVPESELTRDCIAHLDAEGLRFYLPALMLWLLDHYDDEGRLIDAGADLTAIGTILAIAFRPEVDQSYRAIYDGFTAEQRTAMASYVEALPRPVDLDQEDATRVARSFKGYWAQFLGDAASGGQGRRD